MAEQTEYQKDFKKKLDNWDVNSPAQLKEQEKPEFFNEVKKEDFSTVVDPKALASMKLGDTVIFAGKELSDKEIKKFMGEIAKELSNDGLIVKPYSGHKALGVWLKGRQKKGYLEITFTNFYESDGVFSTVAIDPREDGDGDVAISNNVNFSNDVYDLAELIKESFEGPL